MKHIIKPLILTVILLMPIIFTGCKSPRGQAGLRAFSAFCTGVGNADPYKYRIVR